ncbi:MAG: PhoH family protein [Thermoprotei archaeon]|nr:MAG: PhoH family protein [Thermoprotei archaeon]
MSNGIEIKPLTPNQKKFLAALKSPEVDILGVFGPSGTGKSYMSLLYGLKSVVEGRYSKLVLMRPVSETLTGKSYSIIDLKETYNEIVLTYVRDILPSPHTDDVLDSLIREKRFVIIDPNLLTGRTFNNSFIFIDDAQFLSSRVITEALVRMGTNSKLVIAGDPLFVCPNGTNNAILIRELILGEKESLVIDLGTKDIVRPGAKIGFKLYLEMMLRQRKLNEVEEHAKDVILTFSPDADIVTVFSTDELKKELNIKNSPDILVISKEEFLGRIIGKGGERIEKIQEELKMFLRAASLSPDLKNILVALHPLGWISKHIFDLDIIGPYLEVKVNFAEMGAFIGQKGSYVRFLDKCFRKLLGIGIIVKGVEKKSNQKSKRK